MKKLFFLILCTHMLFSWDGTEIGTIGQIHIAQNNNYDFRIYLKGLPKLCGSDNAWAYLNHSDSNYEAYVSVLLMAKATGSKVKIYTNQVGASKYCHIGYIVVY